MNNIFHFSFFIVFSGAIAQLGEHLLCKQGVRGSIPRSSTILDKSILNQSILT